MWIKQKGLVIISFQINSFRFWIPVSAFVLLELMYGAYELLSFFIALSGRPGKIKISRGGRFSVTLKDVDNMIASVIYLLDQARSCEKFDLVDIDAGENSNKVKIKVSFR